MVSFFGSLTPSLLGIYEFTDKIDHIKIRKMEYKQQYQLYKMRNEYEQITFSILSDEYRKEMEDKIEMLKEEDEEDKKHFKKLNQRYNNIEKQYRSFTKSSDIIVKDQIDVADALVLFIVKNSKKSLKLFQNQNIKEFIYRKDEGCRPVVRYIIDTLFEYNKDFIPAWIVIIAKEWLKNERDRYSMYVDKFAKKGLTLVVD